MRRAIPITAFALMLLSPVWAQRGGHFSSAGHAGFSRGSGFASHSSSHFSGAVPASRLGTSRGFAHAPNPTRTPARTPYLHDGFRGDRFRGREHRFGFRNFCHGYPCRAGYGYPLWGYDPWLWWDNDSSNYDEDYDRNLAIANEMNQQSLEEQRLRRQEEADGDQDIYASRSGSRLGGESASSGHPIVSPTVLVFRDRHREEIQNYAIVGETLWNFTGPRTHKIPLAELDLAATVKANDDRGVTFTVPTSSQGQ